MYKKANALGIVVVVLLAVLVLGGGYVVVKQGLLNPPEQSAIQQKIATGDCDTDPYVTLTARDAATPTSAVSSPTLTYSKNGKFIGTLTSGSSGTTFSLGDSGYILVSKATYIDELVPYEIKKCGSNDVIADLWLSDIGSFTVWTTAGTQVTDAAAGGATNQSALSASASGTMKVRIDGIKDKSTGKLLLIIEGSNTTEVDDMVIRGFDGIKDVTIPEGFYSPSSAGSIIKAFEVDAFEDGRSQEGTIMITAESTGIDGTAFYLTAYAQQAFFDTDGTPVFVGYADADETDKTENNFDYDWLIT